MISSTFAGKTLGWEPGSTPMVTRSGRKDKVEFIGGIMGAIAPYDAKEYGNIIEMAERTGAKTCNIAFPRETIVEDIEKFATEVMPSYL